MAYRNKRRKMKSRRSRQRKKSFRAQSGGRIGYRM
jgi:hypothetical protein